jgi:hypothetical protein
VTEECDEPRSYIVKTPSGSELRRNRVQVKPYAQPNSQAITPGPTETPAKVPQQPFNPTQPTPSTLSGANESGVQTRSGRTVKPPRRLDL